MLRAFLALVFCLSTALQPALAAEGSGTSAAAASSSATSGSAAKLGKLAVVDVAVGDKQLLLGQVVSPDGQPRVGVRVAVTTHDGRYAETKTNDQGAFAFRGVSGKAELIGPNCRQPVRAWSGGAAPPSATPAVLLVEGSVLARGQRRPGPFVEGFVARSKALMANPVFVAAAVGTAVAVPVAIANADDDDAATP